MKRHDILSALGKINNTRNYLEIGVEAGSTFNALNFQSKTAVDKKFIFKYENSPAITYHEMTSDEFFIQAIEKKYKYDLIFIDGYHLFEFVLRDLVNSFLVSHKNTIIVLDDVIPSDYFSQLRSQQLCNKLKQENKISNRDWMGDVYKIIPIINIIFNQWSYKTIIDSHSMTILWNQSRVPSTSELFIPDYEGVLSKSIPYNMADFDQILQSLILFNQNN